MAMMEISVVPLATPTPSLSQYVAGVLRVLQGEPGIKYELTAMGTIVEGEPEKLLELAGRMHRAAFTAGVMRVATTIRLDERRDKSITIAGKVAAVRRQLES